MNKNQKTSPIIWHSFPQSLSNNILTFSRIEFTLNKFFNFAKTDRLLLKNPHINILFTVEYQGGVFKSLGKLNKLNISDPTDLSRLIAVIKSWYSFKLENPSVKTRSLSTKIQNLKKRSKIA